MASGRAVWAAAPTSDAARKMAVSRAFLSTAFFNTALLGDDTLVAPSFTLYHCERARPPRCIRTIQRAPQRTWIVRRSAAMRQTLGVCRRARCGGVLRKRLT